MTFGCLTGTASDMPKESQSRHTVQSVLEDMALLNATVERRMSVTNRRFRSDYDRKFRQESQTIVGDVFYIHHPRHS